MNPLDSILQSAKANPRHIVLPEGDEPRTIQAAARLQADRIADITLIGVAENIRQQATELGVTLGDVNIIDPADSEHSANIAEETFQLRQKKGITREQAADMASDPLWFGNMLVRIGHADGAVSGAVNTTANVVRTALQAIGVKPGTKLVSSFFLMIFDQPHQAIQGSALFGRLRLNH